MLLVLADHSHHTAAMDDLALITNLLDPCTYLHNDSPSISRLTSSGVRHGTPSNKPPEEAGCFLAADRRATCICKRCDRGSDRTDSAPLQHDPLGGCG